MARMTDELYLQRKRLVAVRRQPCQVLCNVFSWIVAATSVAFVVLLTVWLASIAEEDVVVSVNNMSVSAHEVATGVEAALSSLVTNTSELPMSCAEMGLRCPETLTGVETAALVTGAIAGNGLIVLIVYWMCNPRPEPSRVRLYPEL